MRRGVRYYCLWRRYGFELGLGRGLINAGPNDISQNKDAQKPQRKQAEGRTQAEKNLKPAKGDTLKDNKPDA